ncbi:MAG: internalin [Solirubrobacteraceae bacterium]|jgi:hypothetical protein|nr:internalin [Solirubrobacteraceae bacterium]
MIISAATPPVPSLTPHNGLILVAVVAAGMLLAGCVVIVGRRFVPPEAGGPGASVVRSWLAISLVMGLVVLCAAAFMLGDTSARSTLFGGLISSASAAVAFYFSTQAAGAAQAGMLNAAQAIPQGTAAPTAFSSGSPGSATVGTEYTYKFVADGLPVPTYGVTTGQLPDGLTLDPDGTLHGIPTRDGSYTFAVSAANSVGTVTSTDITMPVTPA